MKKVHVTIEKNFDDNNLWGRIEGDFGIVVGEGKNRNELLESIKDAWEMQLEDDTELAEQYKDGYTFEFDYDLESVFSVFDELKISRIAELAKINQSLVRQYAKGLAKASEERKTQIEHALHSLGRELIAIQL
jgi:predicted RNase H-like HicB family nuclease